MVAMPSAPPRPVTIAFAGMAGLAIAIGVGRFAFTPILPMMQADSGVTLAIGGWMATANYAGYLLGAIWAAAHRAESTRAIRISLSATVLLTAAMAVADALAAWIALRFLAGLASAWALIHVSTWSLEHLAALDAPRSNGWVFSGVGAGIMVAGLVCLILMLQGASSRMAWLSLGATSGAMLILLWPALHPMPAPAGRGPSGRLAWSADSARLVFSYGALGLGYIIPATFLPAMARQQMPDPTVFGWAWPIFGAAAAASTLLVFRLPAASNRRIWQVGAVIMAAGIVAPAVAEGIGGMAFAAVAIGGTFMVITMVALREARVVNGSHATTLIALMTIAFAVGQILGPVMVSAVVERHGVAPALYLAAALLVLSAASLSSRPIP